MWSQKKHKRATSRCRRLTFDQLEERALLSISYPIDLSAITVDGGALTANFIPVDNLTIDSDATVELTALSGNPTENMSIKNTTNNGSLNVSSGLKTLGLISGTGNLNVFGGATLTATSLIQNTLTIGAGATITIAPIPGGPLSPITTGSTPASADMSATMDGGILTYNSDALPNLSTVNTPTLVCTDPPDVNNAWRSTKVSPGGEIINFTEGDVKTRIMGSTNTYQNRFSQTIVAEQTYQDIAWDNSISNHTAPLSTYQNSATQTLTLNSSDNIDSVIVGSNEITVTTSGQGSTVDMTAGDKTITRNGAEQLHIINNDPLITYEAGGLSYTYDETLFPTAPIAPSGPDWGIYPSPSSYEVAHGTSVFDFAVAGISGLVPSGDFSQPAGDGSIYITENTNILDRSISVTGVLWGLSPPHDSCNTLQSSPISQHAGTIVGWGLGKPNSTMTFSYSVSITLIFTASDPTNPGLGGPPSGKIKWHVWDAQNPTKGGDEISIGSTNPIPNGKILTVNVKITGGVTATMDSTGKAKIFVVTPELANRGPGLVVFRAKAGIYYYGWLYGDQLSAAKPAIQNTTLTNYTDASVITSNHAPLIQQVKADDFNIHINNRFNENRQINQDENKTPLWFHGVGVTLIEPIL